MEGKQYIQELHFPIGRLTMASDGQSITGLWFQGQKYYAATLGSHETGVSLPVFEMAEEWLKRYFQGEHPELLLPLAPAGNEFRQAVWNILCGIPYGAVITYGEIAKQMAQHLGRSSMSAQAVGGAVGHNPISLFIPCHRVVGSNGSLTGYAGGVDKKIFLLQLEKVPMDGLSIPTVGTAL